MKTMPGMHESQVPCTRFGFGCFVGLFYKVDFVNMSSINLDGSDDPFYRYKMPQILLKEQSSKGGQTCLVNLEEISKALDLPSPKPLVKHLSKSLGCTCRLSKGSYLLPGSHRQKSIQDLILAFVSKYILCPSCGNPETLTGKCTACGYNLMKKKSKRK